ncbi:hypothetical protein PESHB4_06580 [Pediococcus ethanolidurans]
MFVRTVPEDRTDTIKTPSVGLHPPDGAFIVSVLNVFIHSLILGQFSKAGPAL